MWHIKSLKLLLLYCISVEQRMYLVASAVKALDSSGVCCEQLCPTESPGCVYAASFRLGAQVL